MRLTSLTSPTFLVLLLTPALHAQTDFPAAYKGTPYTDARHTDAPQTIPGTVHCAFYDKGGEGIAFHDTDPVNHGSGELNPDDGSYLHQFRMHEGVDTSFTKFHTTPDPTDNNPYNRVLPPEDLLYVGWTEPGEWFNITVNVKKAGAYTADLLYTSNRGGTISLDVNGRDATGPLTLRSTYDARDPLAWRQWHHWNLAPGLVRLHLHGGKNLLTVHILTQGQMNLATLNFQPAP